MLRSKKDVDRHVRDIIGKVKSDNERKLRGYNIARLYHNVQEYDLARRYLNEFLSVRPKAIDGHRLLGQILEANGSKEKAVLAYKTAYELGDGQKDLLVKICELYTSVSCDLSVKMHWADLGQQICPHHEAVTKLRSSIISHSTDTKSRAKLQELYLDEIKVNPTSAELQSNLLKLYLDWSNDVPEKLMIAYNYMAEVETRRPFSHSLLWYQTMLLVCEAYDKKGPGNNNSSFLCLHLSCLERLLQLTLEVSTAPTSERNTNTEPYLTQAANLLLKLDSRMYAMKDVDKHFEECMAGQLFLHIAQYLMITAKKFTSSVSPNTILCLLLNSCRYPLPPSKGEHVHLHRLACYRLSQSYHIISSTAKDSGTSVSSLVSKVKQQCTNIETMQDIFKAVFGQRSVKSSSYFMDRTNFVSADLTYPDDEAAVYDQVVSASEGSDLREIVWLCMQQLVDESKDSSAPLSLLNLSLTSTPSTRNNSTNAITTAVKDILKKAQPLYPYRIFEGLQFGCSHVSSMLPDSLCHLDLLGFLAATVYCVLDSGVCASNVRSIVCKASVCSSWLLHSQEQGEWWTAAHALHYSAIRKVPLSKSASKYRNVVQKGLSSLRLLGSSSLPLAVHLAKCYSTWASSSSDSSSFSISEVMCFEERAEHLWHKVLSMIKKVKGGSNVVHHTPSDKIFSISQQQLSEAQLEEAEEEGNFFLAKRLIKCGRRQEALQALGQLKSPHASFQRAMLYKQQAGEMLADVNDDVALLSSDQRNQHSLLLSQMRDTLYLTYDRLRAPGADRNHPLNAQLGPELANVECLLTSLPTVHARANDTSILGTEPLSPINELHDFSSHDLSNGHNGSVDTTPQRSGGRAMRSSTIRRLEARPSPERLDAQVRHLTTVQEQTLQNLSEQNAALRCHNNTLKDTCSTLSLQVKENTTLFRSILEQNKTVSMDCYNNLMAEVKTIVPALKELREGVKKLEGDVREIKAVISVRNEHQAAPPTPHHLPLYYGGYYGPAQPHPPPGAMHPHHPHPPVSSIPGHHLQTPQSPAAYLHPTEQGYPSSSVGSSYHLSRLLSGGTSTPHHSHSTTTNSAGALVSTTEAAMAAQQAYFQSVSSQQQYSSAGESSTVGGGGGAPHDYQIPLPPHSVMPPPTPPSHNTPERQPPMPVKGLLANVPAPLYSAVTPENSPLRPLNAGPIAASSLGGIATPTSLQGGVASVFGSHSTPSALTAALTGKVKSFSTNSPNLSLPANNSVADSSSQGDDYYKNDDDHDPCPDYKPVVPLPEEVEVRTGEEEEEVLFEERAKLFRMVAKEWKERGTGVLKILHHSVNKNVRVLMRREKTLKICANHTITSTMELVRQQGSEIAWTWAAQDFADEEHKSELFCCKFKTPEIATSFHTAFAKANQLAAEFENSPATEKTPPPTSSAADITKPLSELFKKAEGSWNCATCLVDNKPESSSCIACQTPNPAAPAATTKETSSATFGFGSASTFSFGLSGSTTKTPGGSITFGLSSSSLAATTTTSSSVFGSISSTPTTSSLFGKIGNSVTITPAVSAGNSIFGSAGASTPTNSNNTSKSIFATPDGQNSSVSSPSVFGTPVGNFGNAPTTTSAPLTFGGFSFTTTPSVVIPKTEEKQEVPKTEEKKLGLFSGFSFGTPKTSTATTASGGLFSGSSATAGGLTFSGFSPNANTTPESVFKTKNTDAFKPKPLFGGSVNTSQVNTAADDSADHVEEYEPEVHFEPVIPLPELVQVKTGEEEEETLFCERSKLFRWASETKEWKERGLGDVKILSNKDTHKIRIVMRREKTLKICANHYITPDLTIKVKEDCDKALTWAACDFSEGEIIKEKFTLRFKSVDLANSFKAAVEKARDSLGDAVTTVEKVAPKVQETASLMDKFKPAAGSWECDICLLRNTPDCTMCASCQTVKPGCEVPTKPVAETSGFTAKPFSFGSSSTASFSFGVTPSSGNVESKPLPTFSQTPAKGGEKSAFKFGSPDKFEFSFKPKTPPPVTSVSRSRDVSQCESEDGVVDEDEGDHIYFEPVIPLPDKVDVVTGEEEEQELYCHRAKLFRLVDGEWKERGLGNVKLMLHVANKKVRLLMRREQIHKICLNHNVTNDMVFKLKEDKSMMWVAQDFSEGEAVKETFLIRFKTPEICTEFKDSIERVQNGDFTVSTTVGESGDDDKADLAKKLMLPPDFFTLPPKECSGCIGCKVDTLPPFLAPQTPDDNILLDAKSVGVEIPISQKSLFDKKEGASTKVIEGSTTSGSIFGGAKVTEASGSIFSSLKGTATSSSPSAGIFGGATPSSGSIFGVASSKPATSSLFGGAAPTTPSSGSIFGGAGATTPSSGSIFGGAGANTPSSGSIFGGAGTTTPASGSMFGGAAATTPASGSMFGGAAATTPASGSMFGGAAATTPASGSMFGGAPAATPSMFGGAAATTPSGGSMFGGASASTPSGGSMFGGASASTPSSGSIFGGGIATSKSSGSIFGGASTTPQAGSLFGGAASTPPSSGSSLFGGSKTTPSLFGGTASKSNGGDDGMLSFGAMKDSSATSGFPSKDSSFNASAWQAKPAFSTKTIAKINSSTNESQNESDLVEDDDHDPHFEPVVPLPELVDVKTGEEGLIELFCCRSKVYRYENANKEWKERGLGNLKILLDPRNKNFRVLQRREQVHKLSVHHYIVRGQKLTSLQGSDVAWCWFAQDFSDSTSGTSEQFAAKFKTVELAGEFKCKFEECIDVVENPELMNQFITAHGGVVMDTPEDVHEDEDYEDDSTSDDTEDDDDYVESDVMYDSRVHLEKRIGENWEVLGEEVTLRLLWESDVDGTRMMATGEGEGLLLDHLITASMNYHADNNIISWSALDLSTKPACQVKLRVKFNSDIETHQFMESFDEAKSIANLDTTDARQFESCDPKLTEELRKILPSKDED